MATLRGTWWDTCACPHRQDLIRIQLLEKLVQRVIRFGSSDEEEVFRNQESYWKLETGEIALTLWPELNGTKGRRNFRDTRKATTFEAHDSASARAWLSFLATSGSQAAQANNSKTTPMVSIIYVYRERRKVHFDHWSSEDRRTEGFQISFMHVKKDINDCTSFNCGFFIAFRLLDAEPHKSKAPNRQSHSVYGYYSLQLFNQNLEKIVLLMELIKF
jgi:hypothetical protein